MTVDDVREPEIEAPRGTKIVLTAKTTRGVKDAKFEIDGHPPIVGEPVPDQPMWVRFKLPPIDKDGDRPRDLHADDRRSRPAPRGRSRCACSIDQAPTVQIDEPKEDSKQSRRTARSTEGSGHRRPRRGQARRCG